MSEPLAAPGAAVVPADPLAFMDKLSDSVYVYRPEVPSTSTTSPRLVIICAWMGARPAHIAKYLAPYRSGEVFGDSASPAILLLFCHKSTAASSAKAAVVAQTAVPVLREILGDALHPESKDESGLLVHVFSNGGCLVLSQLYNEILQSSKADKQADKKDCLPPHATVFDSCPGNFWYAGAVAAFSTGLERRPLYARLVALPIIYATVTAMYARIHGYRLVLWVGSLLAKLLPPRPKKEQKEAYRPTMDPWRPHNDVSPYGGNRRELRRAYIFSRADKMILAADTEVHAKEARSRGFTVAEMAEFPGSAHVAHLRSDPVRYWQVVRDTYQGGGK